VTDGAITLLSRVTREYYLLLLLAREGNLGRGRFELRKAAAALEKELF
jgi:predicted regulator of Ras-like GTPase activity (Roadblock/LC7/MglB family)